MLLLSVWLVAATWSVLAEWLTLRFVSSGRVGLTEALDFFNLQGTPVVLAAAIAVLWGEKLTAFRPPRKRQLAAVIGLIASCVIFLIAVWVVWSYLTASGSREAREALTTSSGPPVVAAVYLLAIAFGEECIYRGAVYQSFRNTIGAAGAVPLSAGLFACAHAYDLANTAYAFLFGVLAAWLVERSRTLLVPILFHWLMNLVIHAW